MDWQIIAIVLITALTITWFLRTEKRAKFLAMAAKARHFATAPAYRHRASVEPAPRAYVPAGLSPSDRQFLQALAKSARQSRHTLGSGGEV